MSGLSAQSEVVAMLTYFVPTKLPSLEAWSVGKLLIYFNMFKGHVAAAVLRIDPDSFVDLAGAIRQTYSDDRLIDNLLAAWVRRLKEIDQSRLVGENNLVDRLKSFNNRKTCWRIV